MPEIFDESEAIAALREACEEAGSQSEFARRHAVTVPEVSAALGAKRAIPGRVLAALGLQRKTVFVPLET
jgi:hypothetical protein